MLHTFRTVCELSYIMHNISSTAVNWHCSFFTFHLTKFNRRVKFIWFLAPKWRRKTEKKIGAFCNLAQLGSIAYIYPILTCELSVSDRKKNEGKKITENFNFDQFHLWHLPIKRRDLVTFSLSRNNQWSIICSAVHLAANYLHFISK